jgi:hypothetical protein
MMMMMTRTTIWQPVLALAGSEAGPGVAEPAKWAGAISIWGRDIKVPVQGAEAGRGGT